MGVGTRRDTDRKIKTSREERGAHASSKSVSNFQGMIFYQSRVGRYRNESEGTLDELL